MTRPALAAALLLALAVPRLAAHPVPQLNYDRTIRVRLTPAGVRVAYRVEVNDATVLRDISKLPDVDDAKRGSVHNAASLYELFHAGLAPLLADRVEGWQGERPLTFRVIDNDPATKKWEPFEDHLKFEFVLFAPWPEAPTNAFAFRLNVTRPAGREEFYLETGRIDLAFDPQQECALTDRRAPESQLKDRAPIDRTSREEAQLRELSATVSPAPAAVSPGPEEPPPAAPRSHAGRLVSLLDSELGFGLVLMLAVGFGAAHALTPGHGKTLVAAYLVGQRGTVGHAFLLGLVTTLTHTGVVIILAAILPFLARGDQQRVQAVLGFGGGLLIAGLGVWLLLRRLAGGADHVHIGGGHHHHHGPGRHHHHHHHLPTGDRVRLWDLLVLGVSGGIVPCWDAIVLLAMAIGTQRVWLGLPLLLAFSTGLAGVLVLIGILVVKVKGFGSLRFGEGRLVKALPILSALAVMVIGIWLCLDSATGS